MFELEVDFFLARSHRDIGEFVAGELIDFKTFVGSFIEVVDVKIVKVAEGFVDRRAAPSWGPRGSDFRHEIVEFGLGFGLAD